MSMWCREDVTCISIMAHSLCTGPGLGTGLGVMGLCILLCTVHTTQGQGQEMGTGTIGFHTHFAVPGPGPVPCSVNEPLVCYFMTSFSRSERGFTFQAKGCRVILHFEAVFFVNKKQRLYATQ